MRQAATADAAGPPAAAAGATPTTCRVRATTTPGSIGHSASSAGVQLLKEDMPDLYERTAVGTRFVFAE